MTPQFKGMDQFVTKDRGNQYDAFQAARRRNLGYQGKRHPWWPAGGYGVYINAPTPVVLGELAASELRRLGALSPTGTKLGQCYPSISCVLDNKKRH